MKDWKNADEQSAAPQVELAKKVYEKPQIVYCAPLEAMAAVCPPGPPGFSGKGGAGCDVTNS